MIRVEILLIIMRPPAMRFGKQRHGADTTPLDPCAASDGRSQSAYEIFLLWRRSFVMIIHTGAKERLGGLHP